MAPAPGKKAGAQAYVCEAVPRQLKNCLVNLPSELAKVLNERNIVAQNVIVELVWDVPAPADTPASPGRRDQKPQTKSKSIYVGWTGMPSQRLANAVVSRDGIQGRRGSKDQQSRPSLEIDSAFAQLNGITESQKIGVLLHTEPALAHTINIVPYTPADWEIIELHANFLEINLLSQIRAVPNPLSKAASYPLILHLSPTSTATILVSGLKPAPPSSTPFAKISPDAEVHVEPKTRQRPSHIADDDSKSATSIGAKSGASTANTKTRKSDHASSKPAFFFRAVDRSLARDWFDDSVDEDKDHGLRIWLDWSCVTSNELKGVSNVWVSVVRPTGLAEPLEEDPEALKPATKIVAQLCSWEEARNNKYAALSSSLASVLDVNGTIGETVRVEAAAPQAPKSAVRSLRIIPFATLNDRPKDSLKIGGSRQKADAQESAQKLLNLFGHGPGGNRIFDGPITDGMVLPPITDNDSVDQSWQGGVVKLHPPPGPPVDQAKTTRGWVLGSERKLAVHSPADQSKPNDRRLTIEVMPEIPKPPAASRKWTIGEPLPATPPILVGIDPLISQVKSNLLHSSSTLLTGGIGSGKTALAQLLALQLQREELFSVSYYPCQLLVTEETRISTIKDNLQRLFGLAAWRAQSGGHALVILDDLDKLCPVETELEVGGQNERNRHISELVMSTVRSFCRIDSRVVLLATAQNKESVHTTIIGGHVVRETVHLQAPDKDTRRKVLEALVQHETSAVEPPNDVQTHGGAPSSNNVDSRPQVSKHLTPGITPDPSIDYLDLAGRTDGYMPGDLKLLISRARSEALIRVLSNPYPSNDIQITTADFTAALKGFTPSSLRNVTLTHSTTTFSSIGGLRETRQTLLETLQYPTLYAPIFAQCPLRLRSGLLLYGFPGCGKTLLASAVAGECGLNFISVKGPEILNKYIGASEKSVRDLFERAQAARPCVLFFDEFDSVAPKRGHDSTGVTDRVVNQLLTQMDGAEGLSGVYVLAATSRPDLIDPALLRPGRLDKSLLCDMPDEEDRADILKAIASKLRVHPDLLDETRSDRNMHALARRTDGYSGADLQAVIYNAHLEAIHDVLGSVSLSNKPGAQQRKQGAAAASDVRIPDFTYFQMGTTPKDTSLNTDDADDNEHDKPQTNGPISAAQRAADRAKISQSLISHQQARQKARALRRGSTASTAGDAGTEASPSSPTSTHDLSSSTTGGGSGSAEPTIEWRHIERALGQTRPSISRQEVGRLRRIYREFVVGRSGELKDGQGGTEIGARSSLV